MGKLVTYILILLVVVAVITLIGAFALTILWSWVIPDVFAGAVAHGVLPASITLVQALKLSLMLTIMGVAGHSSGNSSKK